MGMYDSYETDKEIEKQGILLDYSSDGFRVRIARAGGANKRFEKVKERIAKPHQRAIETKKIKTETVDLVLMETYAEAVVLNWEVIKDDLDPKVEKNWKKGIATKDGKILPVNKENILITFQNLPSLFADIRSQAENENLFLSSIKEANAKN